jgi:hypothetical protein
MKTDLRSQVALVSGFWGQNIGNAFFNIGGKWILENVFTPERVRFILDQPGYRTFHKQSAGNPKNDFGLLKYLDVGAIVLQGPMLTVDFPKLWSETFEHLSRRGTKIILLGAAMFRFNEEEKAVNLAFLKKYRPAILSTRDIPTYEAFKDAADFSYCGVDSAWFAPDAFEPLKLAAPDYITINFDRWPEPSIRLDAARNPGAQHAFEYLDHDWQLEFPKLQWALSTKDKIKSYLGAMIDWRKLPPTLGPYTIIRPEHRFNPHVTWKIYRQPNAVASDEPWTYFTIYSQTQLTLSDRVHACVATLAYGKPAMLFTPSPRSYLFDRLGLSDIRKRPVTLDANYLRTEKAAQLTFLRQAVAEVLPGK